MLRILAALSLAASIAFGAALLRSNLPNVISSHAAACDRIAP